MVSLLVTGKLKLGNCFSMCILKTKPYVSGWVTVMEN